MTLLVSEKYDDNHSDVDDIVLFLQYIDEQPVEEQHAEEQSDQERYVRIVGGVLANCTTPGGQPKFFFFLLSLYSNLPGI